LAWRDVVILETVDQQDWYRDVLHGAFRRGVCEVDAVTEPSVKEGHLDCRAQNDATQPRAGMKEVTNPYITDPSETGK